MRLTFRMILDVRVIFTTIMVALWIASTTRNDAKAINALDELLDLSGAVLDTPSARRLIDEIRKNSVQGDGDIFVLGNWIDFESGYVQAGRETGALYYHTHPEIYDRLLEAKNTGLISKETFNDILSAINESALSDQIAKGGSFEYTLNGLAGDAFNQEVDAIKAMVLGDKNEAMRLLNGFPARMLEVEWLISAGYTPEYDLANGVIRWVLPK